MTHCLTALRPLARLAVFRDMPELLTQETNKLIIFSSSASTLRLVLILRIRIVLMKILLKRLQIMLLRLGRFLLLFFRFSNCAYMREPLPSGAIHSLVTLERLHALEAVLLHHVDDGQLVPEPLPQEEEVVPQQDLVLPLLLVGELATLDAAQAAERLAGETESACRNLCDPIPRELALVRDAVSHALDA